jgi:hypothetical protein
MMRLIVFCKPILHTLSAKCGDEDAIHVPFQLATQPVRVINDTYNDILASAGEWLDNSIYSTCHLLSGLPSCCHIRQVKKAWADACASRIQGTAAVKTYNASSLGNHGDKTSKTQYGLCLDTVVQVGWRLCLLFS